MIVKNRFYVFTDLGGVYCFSSHFFATLLRVCKYLNHLHDCHSFVFHRVKIMRSNLLQNLNVNLMLPKCCLIVTYLLYLCI